MKLDDRLKQIKEHADAATEGPWQWGCTESMHHVTKKDG
jgi:hypothetical protein